jgi:hypothetical protein
MNVGYAMSSETINALVPKERDSIVGEDAKINL